MEGCSQSSNLPLLIRVLSSKLEDDAKKNIDQLVAATADRGLVVRRPSHPISVFDDADLPTETMAQCLTKLYASLDCSLSCYVMAYIYIHRFLSNNQRIVFTSLNARRLTLISLVAATKYQDRMNNAIPYFAKFGKINVKEMCKVEEIFLQGLGYQCFVSAEEFDSCSSHLLSWWNAFHPSIKRTPMVYHRYSLRSGDDYRKLDDGQQQQQSYQRERRLVLGGIANETNRGSSSKSISTSYFAF